MVESRFQEQSVGLQNEFSFHKAMLQTGGNGSSLKIFCEEINEVFTGTQTSKLREHDLKCWM